MKPVITITNSEVTEVLKNQNGKFFTVLFEGKKDKKDHTINGRTGVRKFSKGGVNPANGKEDLMGAFNVKKMAYRTINLAGVSEIRANGVIYKVD